MAWRHFFPLFCKTVETPQKTQPKKLVLRTSISLWAPLILLEEILHHLTWNPVSYLPYQLVSRIFSVNSGIMSSVLGPISQVGITTTRETRFEEAPGCHDSWFQVGKFGCFNKWSWTRLEISSPVFFSINKSIISTKRELFFHFAAPFYVLRML